jgi:hypothetical protein
MSAIRTYNVETGMPTLDGARRLVAAEMKQAKSSETRCMPNEAPDAPTPRPVKQPEHHHHAYVVLLHPAVGRLQEVRAENPKRDPKKPFVYGGMTGLTPEERFANYKAGTKAAWVVERYGPGLLPQLYAHLNTMPYEAAAQMEQDLVEDLGRVGCTVADGH